MDYRKLKVLSGLMTQQSVEAAAGNTEGSRVDLVSECFVAIFRNLILTEMYMKTHDAIMKSIVVQPVEVKGLEGEYQLVRRLMV